MLRWAIYETQSSGRCGGGGSIGPLNGCGTGQQSTSPLAGNWLIVGSMPTFFPFPPSGTFNLAMTMDVVGENVTATSNEVISCSSTSPVLSFGTVEVGHEAGTIASDGAVSLETSQRGGAVAGPILTIEGKLPQDAGGEWSGSYANGNQVASCLPESTGRFTAIQFPLVNGTYSGQSPVVPESTLKPISIQMKLQQGGPVPNANGLLKNSLLGLTGSLEVQGVSCFSSGTFEPTVAVNGITLLPDVTTLLPGVTLVSGNNIQVAARMNDGSTMLVSGQFADSSEKNLNVRQVAVVGGDCSGLYQPPTLTAQ